MSRVAVDPRVARGYEFMRGIAHALVGTILIGPGGVTVRVLDDGSVAEIRPGGHPIPSAAYDPANARRVA